MMSLESIFSYLFFTLMLLSISAHTPLPEKNTSLQEYSLLLDTITVLEKSGLSWDIENETSAAEIIYKFNQITSQTGFCVTAESKFAGRSLSNCANPKQEKISQEALIISPAGIPQKIIFSIRKEAM